MHLYLYIEFDSIWAFVSCPEIIRYFFSEYDKERREGSEKKDVREKIWCPPASLLLSQPSLYQTYLT